VLGLEVPSRSGIVGAYISEVGLPDGAVIALIVRDGRALAPDVHTRIRSGDQVLVVTTEEARTATEQRIRAVAKRGRLAGWLDSL
jgi:cell volume regulation protein A